MKVPFLYDKDHLFAPENHPDFVLEVPKGCGWITLDTLAECYDVPQPLYEKLWKMTGDMEYDADSNMQPLRGDGSDGTSEELIISESYDNNLKSAWRRFTDEEKRSIIKALKDK